MPLLIVMATAFAVIAPFFFFGNASGHDFEFHMNSWMEVVAQWRQGILLPRWAELAHFGYGEPRFLFYPPFSWMLGGLLGVVLPWRAVPGAFIWIAVTLSGCSMFLLARRWLAPRDAIFAAALYAANPYHLVIVYWRSAMAELLAGALMPVLLLLVFRLERRDERVKSTVVLAVVVAAAWLTNVPAAVMLTYSLPLLMTILAVMKRSPRLLADGGLAVLLGAALAGFYLVPAAYEQPWVHIMQVLEPGVRPLDNFLFTNTADADHNHFNLLISTVAVAEIAALVAAGIVVRLRRRDLRFLWWVAAIWSGTAALAMIRITWPAWEYLPKLKFAQLPWRWLLCMNVGLAVLLAIWLKRWRYRIAIYAAMLLVLAGVWRWAQQPWWDNASDIRELLDNQQDGPGYEGVDEYTPIAGDPTEIEQDARRVTLEGPGTARLRIQRWDPELRAFSATVSQPGNLVLRLFNYPAWRVVVNGKTVAAGTHEITGQMMVPVQAGENQVQIVLVRTCDRTVGAVLSIITAAGLVLFVLVWVRKKPDEAGQMSMSV